MTAKYTSRSKDLREALPPRVFDLFGEDRAAPRGMRVDKAIHVVVDCKSRKMVGLRKNTSTSVGCDIAKARRDLAKTGMALVKVGGNLDPEVTWTCVRQASSALSHARLSKLSADELLDLIFEQASSDEVMERYHSLTCCPAQDETDEGS